MRYARLYSILIALALAGTAIAVPYSSGRAGKSAGDDLLLLQPSTTRTELDSGLVVISEEMTKELVSIQLWVKTGSVAEGKYMGTGISHFVEHMLFKSTENYGPGQIAYRVRSLGGDMNGYTSTDHTVFDMTLPAEHAEKGVEMLAEAASRSSFDPEEFKKEKDVILREIDMGRDDPDKKLSRLLWSTAFQTHPYRHPVIGYRPLFEELTRDDLLAYYGERYTPNNMVLVVVGGVSSGDALAMAKKYFGEMKRARPRTARIPEEPRQLGERRQVVEWDVNMAHMSMGYHIPDLAHPDLYALDIAAMILGHGQSSRLFRKIRNENATVHAISAWSYTPRYPGLFGIGSALDDDKLERAQAEIEAELEDLKITPIPTKELEKTKRMALASHVRGLETVGARASELASNETVAGDVGFSLTYTKNLQKVTAEDIMRVAAKYFTRDNLTTVALRPRTQTGHEEKEDTKISDAIVTKLTLSNGATLIVAPRPALPLVSVKCVWLGGRLLETEENAGVASLLSTMMMLGMPDRVQSIEERGGGVSAYAGNNTVGCSLSVLKDDFDKGLSVLAKAIKDPNIPTDVLEKEKATQLAALKSQQDEIFQAAMVEFRKAFFGEHPYHLTTLGKRESVELITEETLRDYRAKTFVPSGMVAAVWGDTTVEEARVLFEKHLGGRWAAGELPAIGGIDRTKAVRMAVKALDKKQAVIIIGHPGGRVAGPERHVLSVIAATLSGQGSRLWEEVREKRGLAYSVGAFNILGIDPGSFVLYASVEPDKVEEVKEHLLNEIERLKTELIDDEELESAKTDLIGDHLRSRESNSGAAFSAALNEIYGLGYDAAERYPQTIREISAEDIRRVARERFVEEARTVVIVGPE